MSSGRDFQETAGRSDRAVCCQMRDPTREREGGAAAVRGCAAGFGALSGVSGVHVPQISALQIYRVHERPEGAVFSRAAMG